MKLLCGLFFFFYLTIIHASLNQYEIEKESYLTFFTFKKEQIEQTKSPFLVPDNWLLLESKSPILAKYRLDEATELSITRFSGNIGDELSNVNRWRRQLALLPIDQDELSSFLTVNNEEDYLVKIVRLESSTQFILIYWITLNSVHFFVKVESSQPIIDSAIEYFVKDQKWQQL